ncbi:hypothetical protein I7I53_05228 [Histoplasma capsulatum var. duboisii H88]|uniref:Uncharacterized protein n=1 Tax=Ajellomyces capsulatus (strain H88) TaxID=544711 RepID=A0A8A1LY91_AJEC8|nr:hypothetical protein I7I53_05228 [Histoplasma capsulatum var. duboisii H88]
MHWMKKKTYSADSSSPPTITPCKGALHPESLHCYYPMTPSIRSPGLEECIYMTMFFSFLPSIHVHAYNTCCM